MKGRLFGRLPDHHVVLLSQVAAMLMAVLGFVFTLSAPEFERPARLTLAFVFLLLAVVFMLASVEQQKRYRSSQRSSDDRAIAGSASTDIQFADIRARLVNIQASLPPPTVTAKETEQAQRDEIDKVEAEREGKIYLAAPTFTPESLAELRAQLSRVRGRVNIMALIGDTDSLGTAREFAAAFRDAGWTVTGVDRVGGFSAPVKGVFILARTAEPSFAGFVQAALDASMASAGVKTKGSLVPTMAEDEIAIIVGETEW